MLNFEEYISSSDTSWLFVDAIRQSMGVFAKAAMMTLVESEYGFTLKPDPELVKPSASKSSVISLGLVANGRYELHISSRFLEAPFSPNDWKLMSTGS